MLLHALLLVSLLLGAVPQLGEAEKLFAGQKVEGALDLYRKAAEAAERDGDTETRVEALAQVARCLSLLGKLEEGAAPLAEAAKLASPEQLKGWPRYLGVRGIFERESGDRVKAKATFEALYAYCTQKKLDGCAIDAVHHIAIVVPPVEQPTWELKGIEAAERLGDEKWLAILWNNLGASHEDLREYGPMQEAYLKARLYHHRTGGETQKLTADWAVGHGYRLLGENEAAREWLEKTLRWAERRHAREPGPETAEWAGWCRKDLGEAIAALGDKAKGLLLLKRARASLVEAEIGDWAPDTLGELDSEIRSLEAGK